MAASVRIEDEAFSDRRYDRLAQEAGLADADHARGKMALIWRQCTLEQCHVLPLEDVLSILGPSGEKALLAARLGDKHHRGIRIRGTKGRIEWLQKLRKNGAKGGRPKGSGKKPEGYPSGSPDLNPPAPAPAPALNSPSESTPPAKPKTPRKEPDGAHHEFVRAFEDAWFARYGETYPFVGGKDGAAVKWFRSQVGDDLDRFRSVVRNYLEDASQFVIDARHPIGLLRSQWARWAVKPPPGVTARSGLMDQFRASAEIFNASGDDHDAGRVHEGRGVLDGR